MSEFDEQVRMNTREKRVIDCEWGLVFFLPSLWVDEREKVRDKAYGVTVDLQIRKGEKEY